jgi:autotransporter-associated beta strand protein
MRFRKTAPVVIASLSALTALSREVRAAGPYYNIYAFPLAGGYGTTLGQGVSPNGTFAAGMAFTGFAGNTSGVLYNIPAGTSTLQSQTGVGFGPPFARTNEYTGVPYSVNDNGISFGSSGAGSTVETGAPTVWQGSQAYNLPTVYGSYGGQVFGSNDQNFAVGSEKSSSAGADQAAIYYWAGPNNVNNNALLLGQSTDNSNSSSTAATTLNVAYGISASGQIVGQANQINLGHGYVPFILQSYDAAAATVIPPPNGNPAYNGGEAFAISDNGLATGVYTSNQGNGVAFVYNSSSNTTIPVPALAGVGGLEGKGINSSGEVVGYGGNLFSVPFLYNGTATYDLQNLLQNNQSFGWQLDTDTSNNASSISDTGIITGRGDYNGNLTAFVMIPATSQAATLTFNGSGGSSAAWDTVSPNWNNGSGTQAFTNGNTLNVVFDDSTSAYNVSLNSTVTPASTEFRNTAGNYVITGTGGISGTGGLELDAGGSVTLNVVNTYTGATVVHSGTLIIGVQGAMPAYTNLSIKGPSAKVVIASTGPAYAVTTDSVALAWGKLDLTNNDLIVHGGSLSDITGLVREGFNGGTWNGSGIMSSTAAANSLTALGTIVNDNGSGTPLYGTGGVLGSTFGGQSPVDGDILVKYTYYGDANLDGTVNSVDYTRLDAAYLADAAYLKNNPKGANQPLTGWYNGDFNYDGSVNGSDYTLIDNAYINQGSQISSQIASVTSQIAAPSSAVPEPGTASLALLAVAGLLGRRSRGRALVVPPIH